MASFQIEFVGWVGAGLIILAYFFLTTKRVSFDSKAYHFMNLLGSAFLGLDAFANRAFPSLGINAFMVLIAGYGLAIHRLAPSPRPALREREQEQEDEDAGRK